MLSQSAVQRLKDAGAEEGSPSASSASQEENKRDGVKAALWHNGR